MNTTTIRKNAETFLKDALGQVNTQFQQVEGATRGLAERIESTGKERVEALVNKLPFAQGIALGQSSIEKLGLSAELEKMAQVVQSAKEQVEGLLKKGNEAEAELAKANKRIAELEAQLAEAKKATAPKAKKATGKKPVAKKAAPKKAAPKATASAKKPAPKKPAAKKPVAKKAAPKKA